METLLSFAACVPVVVTDSVDLVPFLPAPDIIDIVIVDWWTAVDVSVDVSVEVEAAAAARAQRAERMRVYFILDRI